MINKIILNVFLFIILLSSFGLSEELEISEDEINELELEIDTINAGSINGFDRFIDDLRFRFSGNDPEVGLKIAQERLEEVKKLRAEKNFEKAEEISDKHQEILNKIRARIESSTDDENELKNSLRLRLALESHELDIQALKEQVSDLSSAERRALLALLLSMEDGVGKFRLELENKEDRILTKIEERSGRSKLELRDELYKMTEEVKLKAEVFDDFSIVTVDYRFREKVESGDSDLTVDDLVNKILENVQLNENEASNLIRIVNGNDDFDHDFLMDKNSSNSSDDFTDEKLRTKIDIKKKEDKFEARVVFRMRFVSENIDEKGIITDYVSKAKELTSEIIKKHSKIKEEIKDRDHERNIEVKVRNQIAEVKAAWDGSKDRFIIHSSDKETIILEIAARLDASVDDVREALKKFEVKDRDGDSEEDDHSSGNDNNESDELEDDEDDELEDEEEQEEDNDDEDDDHGNNSNSGNNS